MAYDAYGRPQRGNGDPGYFEPDHAVPEYTNYYSSEPRDENPAYRRREAASNMQRRFTPPPSDNTTTISDRTEPVSYEDVSPDLIATITERVKKELVEHLKQTGTIDDQPRAPPMQRDASNKSSSTSSPPPTARRVYTPPSPTQSSAKQSNVSVPAMDTARSPPATPLDKPSGVRFSSHGAGNRPPTMSRKYSQLELSTIDQKWGMLFTNDGTPTKRLGEFLRGLANHIIEDFSPKKSIVVTPSKMAEFYTRHPVANEPFQLVTIFRAQSNEQISRLYQDLGCQHHLVQEDCHSAPVIPALTPFGFAHWMTIHILAYPEEESKRLEDVVLAIPIDADGCRVDGKPERLPKQISRHLLPEREDYESKKLLDRAMKNFMEDLGTTNAHKPSITSSSTSRRSSSSHHVRPHPVEIHQAKPSSTATKAYSTPIERERQPYSGAPSAVSEGSSGDDPVRLERERAPYTAQPGSGKVHTDASNLGIPSRLGRSNSTANRPSREVKEPVDADDTRHQRTQSNTSQNYSRPRSSRRTNSPPMKGFSNSTPDDIHNTTSSKYGPNPSSSSSSFATFSPGSYGSNPNTSFPPPPGPPPIDIHRRPRDDRYRRGEEDERYAGEFSSPREAERWDRYEDSRAIDPADRYERGYERGSVTSDPRDSRGAPAEDWYRERDRGRAAPAYDSYGRRYP